MKIALVTGATGFVGRHTLSALVMRGYRVHALAAKFEKLPPSVDGITWHQGDIMDHAAMKDLISRIRPSHLLHLAWNAKQGVFWQASDNLDWVSASLTLLRAFSEAGGSRFVGAGSCAEYEWSGDVCHETKTPLRPNSLYGVAKKALYEILKSYAPSAGISWAWPRFFFLFGPGEQSTRFVPYLIRNSLLRQHAACRFGQLQRDYMQVKDVADACAAILDSEVSGPVNVASGTAVPLRAIAEKIARLCAAGDILEVREEAPAIGEPLYIGAAIDRLREEVKWQPRCDLDSGLADAVAWWKENLANAER